MSRHYLWTKLGTIWKWLQWIKWQPFIHPKKSVSFELTRCSPTLTILYFFLECRIILPQRGMIFVNTNLVPSHINVQQSKDYMYIILKTLKNYKVCCFPHKSRFKWCLQYMRVSQCNILIVLVDKSIYCKIYISNICDFIEV